MTDETNPSLYDVETETRQQRLDNIINSRSSRFNVAASPPVSVSSSNQGDAHIAYDTKRNVFINRNTGSIISADEVERTAAASPNTERLHDDGRSLQGSWEQLVRQWKDFERRYEEHTFDPVTGEKKYTLSASERAAVLKQWKSFDESVKYERDILNRLNAQRARDRANAEQVAIDEAALDETLRREAQNIAFTKKAEKMADAILAEEARRERSRW